MMQISRSEHELSELPCFRIRTDPELLPQWKHLFCEQPTQSFSKGKVLIPQSCKLTKVYYVLDGFIEYRYTDSDGEQHLIDLMSRGNLCGLHSLFSSTHRTFVILSLNSPAIQYIPDRKRQWKLRKKPMTQWRRRLPYDQRTVPNPGADECID